MANISSVITAKLKIKLPIIQAPMAGGATTPELVAAVSNSGALGSFAAGYLTPEQIRSAIRKIRTLTSQPFAINLFIPETFKTTPAQIQQMQYIIRDLCPELNLKGNINLPSAPIFNEQIQVVIDEKVPVFSFTFGALPAEYISKLKRNQTILIGTATHVAEAIYLAQSGIDMIVAQGSEAGGHRGSFIPHHNNLIGLFALIQQLITNVTIPVIAAGGIMNNRGIMAALMLGASAVQMGTAFLTCHESGIHDNYKQVLLNTKTDNTVLTKAFSGKMARGIENEFIKRMNKYTDKIVDYPIQNILTQEMRSTAASRNNTEFMALWAGQAAHMCQSISVAELIEQLAHNIVD